MRKLSARQWFLGLLLLGSGTLLARELSAEIPTVKGIGKMLSVAQVEKSAAANAITVMGTVPQTRIWVITDVILSNPTASAGTIEILDAAPGAATNTKLPAIQLAAKSTFAHQFGTGLQFAAGHELRVAVTGAGAMDVLVSGYFRKG